MEEKEGAEESECESGGVWLVERDWLEDDGLREDETWCVFRRPGS